MVKRNRALQELGEANSCKNVFLFVKESAYAYLIVLIFIR